MDIRHKSAVSTRQGDPQFTTASAVLPDDRWQPLLWPTDIMKTTNKGKMAEGYINWELLNDD